MKKRWLCLFVENEIGVLARISGLFSGKSYNLHSLTVGVTEDETISRVTIGLHSDEQTFEQIKKQLNRAIEVIKVVEYTDLSIQCKELMFLKITKCSEPDKTDLFRLAKVYDISILEFNRTSVLLQSVKPECQNDDLVKFLRERFANQVEIARGGGVAIESL